MKNKEASGITSRIIKDKIFKFIVILFAFLSTVPLLLIFFHIFNNGISSLNWHFIVNLPKPVGEEGGGISNAIIGTLILIILSSLIAIPVGIACGIYLSEQELPVAFIFQKRKRAGSHISYHSVLMSFRVFPQ